MKPPFLYFGGKTAVAEALNGCASAVVLSGYDSPLYSEMYGEWYQTQIAAQAGNGNARDRTEVLWSNRPFPPAVVPAATLFDVSEATA